MELKIKCIENWNEPHNYSTTFEYLDKLVDGLSNSMVGLEWEDCEVGEEITVNPDHM